MHTHTTLPAAVVFPAMAVLSAAGMVGDAAVPADPVVDEAVEPARSRALDAQWAGARLRTVAGRQNGSAALGGRRRPSGLRSVSR